MTQTSRKGFAARKAESPSPKPSPQVLHLPFPPPLNNLYDNAARGRVKSDRYKAWITEAGWLLLRQRPRPIKGPFMVTMVFTRPDRRKRDLDGTMKAPMDLLVAHGVVEDDHLCQSLRLSWSEAEPDKAGGVRLTVEAA